MEDTEADEHSDSGVDTEGGMGSTEDLSSHPMTQTKLFQAIQNIHTDSLQEIRTMIASGEDVKMRGVYDETYLHLLCTPLTQEQTSYLPPLVYVLVTAGVDINAQDKEGNTVLHVCAINESSASLLKAFLRVGADPSIVNSFDNAPVDFADDPEHRAILERYHPGIIKSIQIGAQVKVHTLVDHWFNITLRHNGQKLSKVAKKAGHSALSEWLSEHKKQSSFVHAVLSGDVDTVTKLLETDDIEVDIRDKSCLKPDGAERMWPIVAEAIHTGVPQTAALLLKKTDVNQTVELESGELVPLFVWVLNNIKAPDSQFIKSLLKKADFSLYKADYLEALFTFWQKSFPTTILECFANKGFDLMTRDASGNTLRDKILLQSYTLDSNECREQLMFVDKYLIKLIKDGATEQLQSYLLRGWDLQVTDNKGLSALQIAKKAKQQSVVELLEKAPATVKTLRFLYKAIELGNLQGLRGQLHTQFEEARDDSGRTLLHMAVMYERHFIIIFLLKRHPQIINQTDAYGRSALHYGYWLRLPDIVEKLREAGADDNLTDKFGKKPGDYKRENKTEAEQERHQQYGVKARLLNAYLRAREVIASESVDNVSPVERVLGGVSVGELEELQVLCPDLPYRHLLFLCVEHRKENTARGLLMSGADMDISEQAEPGDTGTVVTFIQAAEEAGLQALVAYCKKKMTRSEKNKHWERAAMMSLARAGLETRGPSSRGLTALSRHSWDSVMAPSTAASNVGQRSASVDMAGTKDRYQLDKTKNTSSSCVIL